jgi:diamine N-acetyltransferase
MNKIRLRALEPADLNFLSEIENDTSLWHLSHTQQPFSKQLLAQYIREADRDIYEAKQFRFATETVENKTLIGFIDLFDFDPKNRRAGIGIIIAEQYRRKGYAATALKAIIEYAFDILFLHQIYANISIDNTASIRLFEQAGFIKTGQKKEWNYNGKEYVDELLYQLIDKK